MSEPKSHSVGRTAELLEYAGPFLVDAHVHLHVCFEVGVFFAAADRNFRHATQLRVGWPLPAGASERTPAGHFSGVLIFTEGTREDAFSRLENGTLDDVSGRWSFERGGDGVSLVASSRDGIRILLVAGRQIVSRERLEVLLIGSRARISDGHPFRDTLHEAVADVGVTAVPWGFGKWWGARGKLVRESLDSVDPAKVFVADNGGRPRGLVPPRLIRWAIARGHGLLSGTDPLPLPWQAERTGRYGVVVEGTVPAAAPGRGVADLLRKRGREAVRFGLRDSWPEFVRAQWGIRRGG